MFLLINLFYFVGYLSSWAQGYDGGTSSFVNKETLCYVCGNTVKFINVKDKSEAFLLSPGDGIGRLATNPNHAVYGFSEMKPSPQIFVYQFPNFGQPQAILKGRFRNTFLVQSYD